MTMQYSAKLPVMFYTVVYTCDMPIN